MRPALLNLTEITREQIEPLLHTARLAGSLQVLSDAAHETIISHCRFFSIKVGTRVIHQGDDGDCLILVVDGRLEVRRRDGNGSEIDVGTVGAGGLLGESAISNNSDRFASVDAATDATLGLLYRADFERMISTHPVCALRLIEVLFNQVNTRVRIVAEQLAGAAMVRDAAARSVEILSKVLIDSMGLAAPR